MIRTLPSRFGTGSLQRFNGRHTAHQASEKFWWIGIVVAALAIGLAAVKSPTLAFIGVGIATVAISLTLKSEKLPFVILSLIVISPNLILPYALGLPPDGIQKLALLGALLILVGRYGLKRKPSVLPLICAFGIWSVYSLMTSEISAILHFSEIVRALMGFTFAWIAVQIRWPPHLAVVCLRFVSYLPTLSILAGIPLQLLGMKNVVAHEYTGAYRLAGALLPAHLAMLAYFAVAASIYLSLIGPRSKKSMVPIALNVAILVLTLTRGAIIALIVLVALFTLVSAGRKGVSPESGAIKRTLLGSLVLLVLLAAPLIALRNSGGSESGINTSGREDGWAFYLALAEKNPWMGHGLGFSNIAYDVFASRRQGYFNAPHNEYLHLYLDVGLAGLFVVVALLIFIFISVYQMVPRNTKAAVLAVAAGFAVYAITDNVISTAQATVPLALTLGAITSLGVSHLKQNNSGAQNT